MKCLVNISLDDYRVGNSVEARGRLIQSLLETWFEAMTLTNCAWMLATPKSPLLYHSGVRYQRDPDRSPGGLTELWLDAPSILDRGADDCEGLSSFLAAELRTRSPNSVGRQKRPAAAVRLKTTRTPGLLHAIVIDLQTGEIFDPSKMLGMGRNGKK